MWRKTKRSAAALVCAFISLMAVGCGRLHESSDARTSFDAGTQPDVADAKDDSTNFEARTDVSVVAADADPIIVDAGSSLPTTAALPEAAGLIGCQGAQTYAGPLCQGKDCVVLGTSVIAPSVGGPAPAALVLGNDCQPHIAYTYFKNESGQFVGGYLTLEGGVWRSEDFGPFGYPVGIVVDPTTQVPSMGVMTDGPDGSHIFSFWRREASGWTDLGAFDGTYYVRGDLARDLSGTSHVIRQTTAGIGTSEYGTYDGIQWKFQTLDGPPFSVPNLAFSATGVAQFTYATMVYATDATRGGLLWSPLGQPPELITTGVFGPSRLAVSDADPDLPSGTPHIIYVRGNFLSDLKTTTGNVGNDLSYATRTKEGWIVSSIRKAPPPAGPPCPEPASGAICNYDYEGVAPLTIMATEDGQVRMLYLHFHPKGTATAQWTPNSGWYWSTPTRDDHDTQLWMAWPSGSGQVSSALLLDHFDVGWYADIFFHSPQAAIDPLGRIHLVARMLDDSLSYLVIGQAATTR